jgi:putative transposase
MIRSHKIRLSPNKAQAKLLDSYIDYSRYIWNKALAQWEVDHETGGKPSGWSVRNYLKENKEPWESQFSPQIIDTVTDNLEAAYKAFFRKDSKCPSFKTKKRGNKSFSFYRKNPKSIRVDGDHWDMNKHTSIKMTESLRFDGKIKKATVSRSFGKYYISFLVEVPDRPPIDNDKSVGLDFGLKHFITTSDRDFIEYPDRLLELFQKQKRLQKDLSHKVKGSNNYWKARTKLSRNYEKSINYKKDLMEKISTNLCREYSHIRIEDLSMRNMRKFGKRWRNKMSRMPWYEFSRMLAYKCQDLRKIDRWFPSTQVCHNCGAIHKMGMNDRIYRCECGYVEDRDINAAKNILSAALN